MMRHSSWLIKFKQTFVMVIFFNINDRVCQFTYYPLFLMYTFHWMKSIYSHTLMGSIFVTRYGPLRPKSRHFLRIELLILSLGPQCQHLFGPNPIFLPYSAIKLRVFVLSIFWSISLFFIPILPVYLSFTVADCGLNGPYRGLRARTVYVHTQNGIENLTS